MNEKIGEDWSARQLCTNGLCLGVLSSRGECSECGGAQHAGNATNIDRVSFESAVVESTQQDEGIEVSTDLSRRALCVDPMCLGVVEEGQDCCNVCGKTRQQ